MNNSNKNTLEIVENVCPHCGEHLIMNKRSFANHVRWCKSNPRYEEILQGTLKKLKVNKTPREKHVFMCENCGQEYILYLTKAEFANGKYRKTCCNKCSQELTLKKTPIETWTKVSRTLKEKFHSNEDDYDMELGYKKKCPICHSIFYSDRKNQIYCSKECAHIAKREVDLKNRDEIHIYKLVARFQFSLRDYPDEFDFDLIREHGWYEASNRGNNPKGVSRDHMFSVNEGYKQGIDPYYISHPANCKLMKQEDNFKKLTECSITKEELYQRVKDWNTKYGIYENKINYDYIERFKE